MKIKSTIIGINRAVFRLVNLSALALLLIAGSGNMLKAQPIPCPPNIDFEQGDFTNWLCYTGDCNGSISGATWGAVAPPVFGRHTITSGVGLDQYGFFPQVAPGGGTYSLKLGDNNVGGECERVRYVVSVPVNQSTYSFIYKYAVVFQNPQGHAADVKPTFQIKAYDAVTGDTIPCAQFEFIAGVSSNGFLISPSDPTVLFQPWLSGTVNLSGQGGKTIYIEFSNYDCGLGGHFGYGYVDMISCGQFLTAIANCNLDGSGITLSAPPGFKTYAWYNEDYSTVVGTTQNVILNNLPLTPTRYHVVLEPFTGVGCPDTLTTGWVANIDVDASPDTLCFLGNQPIDLSATVQGGIPPLTYQWTGPNLSCNDCPDPTAYAQGSQQYVIRVTDSNGCFRSDTLQFIESEYAVDAGPDRITCLGNPITIDAQVTPPSSNYVYNWSPTLDLNNPNLLNPVYTPSNVGEIMLYLTVDSASCHKTDSMVIRTLPNDFIALDTTVCDQAAFTAPVFGDTSFTYRWSPPIGLSDTTVRDPLVFLDTTRVYTITASHPACPDIVKSVKYEVEPTPQVDIGPDTSKCQWDVLPIRADVLPAWFPNYSYQWRPNNDLSSLTTPNVLFTGEKDTFVIVQVSTPYGCVGGDTMFIQVHEGNFASVSPTDTAICPGGSVQMSLSGAVGYDWNPPYFLEDTTDPNPLIRPVTDVDYTIFASDPYGCLDTLYSSITVHAASLISLEDSVELYPGETYQINPQTNALHFNWWPPVGLSSTTVSNPVASPEVETRYYVQASTENGCTSLDSIYIHVSGASLIDVPNAFSPGSQPNGVLKVEHRGFVNLKYFRIYNRWGTLVFETTDINEGWDGRYNGEPQPMGVYIYSVEAVNANGQPVAKHGNVTLIR